LETLHSENTWKFTGTSIVPENTLSWLHQSQTLTSGRALLGRNNQSYTVYNGVPQGLYLREVNIVHLPLVLPLQSS